MSMDCYSNFCRIIDIFGFQELAAQKATTEAELKVIC